MLARAAKTARRCRRGKLDDSLLWQRVAADEMPPDDPLEAEEKRAASRAGSRPAHRACRLKAATHPSGDHWAFVPLAQSPAVAAGASDDRARNDVDRFCWPSSKRRASAFNRRGRSGDAHSPRGVRPDWACRRRRKRSPRFRTIDSADAYERMVDRYLASPHYGERWGKFWLDAAGYADSNGYFNADSDRPLAYRYRDYVVRSVQRGQAVRPVRARAARRRRAGRVTQPGEATTRRSDLAARSDALPAQRPGRHRRKRRQRRGTAHRPLRGARIVLADRRRRRCWG